MDWLSNQGIISASDTTVTNIALNADNTIFINNDFNYDKRQDDFLLLDELNTILINNNEAKVIFIHMYGSHVNACERLFDYPNNYNLGYGKSLDCYLATINKLDTFIQNIQNQLITANKDYSLIYFSDHGQKLEYDGSNTTIGHNPKAKQTYQVPLFILDNKLISRTHIKKPLSSFHFLDLFANHIGITSEKINPNYTIFSYPTENIKVFNFEKIVNYLELDDNSIIK